MGIIKIGFIFCLRFRRHFPRHTDFSRFEIFEKKIFLIQVLGIIEKYVG